MTADAARTQIVSEEVTFVAASRNIPGTLVHPESGTGPGVLLLAGSGPTDRDWNSPLLPGTPVARRPRSVIRPVVTTTSSRNGLVEVDSRRALAVRGKRRAKRS